MNDLAKLLLSLAIVGFLPVVPLTSGEAACKPTEAVSRKDAEDRNDAKTAISGDQTSKIDAAVTAFRSRQSIPGISVAIVRDNQIIFRRGYGLADLENQGCRNGCYGFSHCICREVFNCCCRDAACRKRK